MEQFSFMKMQKSELDDLPHLRLSLSLSLSLSPFSSMLQLMTMQEPKLDDSHLSLSLQFSSDSTIAP
jgi:hypothetical protein